MEDKLIELKDVYWQRQGQQILKGVQWQVNQGEQWAMLGLNGSGKTSILNIITGYNFPTSGSVKVLDTQFGQASIPKLREKIGYVSTSLERFGSTFNKQPVKNIILSGKFSSIGLYSNQEVTDDDHTFSGEIMERLSIDHLKGQKYSTLSQGEKRRTLIGRALMSRPQLLILDEPCAGLDILAREELLNIMDSMTQLNCHVIYVTHYIEEITPAITHVLLIKDGQIIEAGPKVEVLTDALLTETFKIPVKVRWENERPWITVGD